MLFDIRNQEKITASEKVIESKMSAARVWTRKDFTSHNPVLYKAEMCYYAKEEQNYLICLINSTNTSPNMTVTEMRETRIIPQPPFLIFRDTDAVYN